jgi:hypothetical protein
MSYVAEVLQPGETLRFRTNIHWFVYLNALLALIVGLALLRWYYAEGQSIFILLFGGVVFTLTALVLAVPAWLRRFATEVAVTDRRVIYKTGLIQRHTIEINIDKIESANVDQSILGRHLRLWLDYHPGDRRGCGALAQHRPASPATNPASPATKRRPGPVIRTDPTVPPLCRVILLKTCVTPFSRVRDRACDPDHPKGDGTEALGGVQAGE